MGDKLRSSSSRAKKPTTAYEMRKERRRNLVDQAQRLQKELEELKFLLLVKQGQAHKVNRCTQTENDVLYEFVQERHLAFATTQAALMGHVQRNLNVLQPAQSVIRLGLDRAERRKTLMSLRERKLSYAERFLATRSQGLSPTSSYYNEERFNVPEQGYCVVRFESLPIRGAQVSEVFDAVLGCILNAEMFLSEMFGNVTVREDSEFENTDVAQIRLASAISSGTIVESNTVMFSRFVDGIDGGPGGYGIMVADFVDSDELYPYRTAERVRGDTTTMVKVQPIAEVVEKGGPWVDEPGVVVTRWTFLKVHRSHVSQDPEREMKESSICWGETARRCVEQQLVHAPRVEVDQQ